MKKESGVTLIALITMIIVILIIASISIYEGTKLIKESKMQKIETNMLLIQAKVKSILEETNAKNWLVTNENKDKNDEEIKAGIITSLTSEENSKMHIAEDTYVEKLPIEINKDSVNFLTIKLDKKNELGLSGIGDIEKYLIELSCETGISIKLIDIIYIDGIDYNGSKYYQLSELQKVVNNE